LTCRAVSSFATYASAVTAPAGYRFADYWKPGLPLMVWFFIVATFLVPFMRPL
jgi:di/tricarboxylate transporter